MTVRVVSLVPSLTETVFALGAGPLLVGRTRYCVEPAGRVLDAVAIGGAKDPDLLALTALRPSLVLMSVEENRREDYERIRAAGIDVLAARVASVADVPPLVLELGRRLGVPAAAQTVAAEIEGAVQAVGEFAADIQQASRQSLLHGFCPVWRDPWMVASARTYLADMLRCVGVPTLFPDAGPAAPAYREVDLDEVIDLDPGIVLLPSEPYPFGPDDRDEVLSWPIRASRDAQVHLVDGRMLTWYGARTPSALHALSLLAMKWFGADDETGDRTPPSVH